MWEGEDSVGGKGNREIGRERDGHREGSERLVVFVLSLQEFPQVQDFEVQHDYLLSSDPQTQIRIRKRGQNGMTSLLM